MQDFCVTHYFKNRRKPFKKKVRVRYEPFVPRTERTHCVKMQTGPAGIPVPTKVAMKSCPGCGRKFATGTGLAHHKRNFPQH